MRRPRRNHSAAYKSKGADKDRQGRQDLSELAEQFDVHPNRITQWKALPLERATDVFASAAERKVQLPDLKTLHVKIGQLTLENDFYPARSRAWTT